MFIISHVVGHGPAVSFRGPGALRLPKQAHRRNQMRFVQYVFKSPESQGFIGTLGLAFPVGFYSLKRMP